jgi:hypothetical protein
MSLQYVRKREGDSFRFISGGERQPISYRTIYDGIKVKGQGVDDTLEKNQKIKVKNDPQNPVNTKNKEGGYPH